MSAINLNEMHEKHSKLVQSGVTRNHFRKKCVGYADQFAERTSMHGIKQVVNGGSASFWNCFWIIVIASSFCGCTYQIQKQIKKFLLLPSQTDVQIETNSKGFVFPDVTFCDPLSKKLDNTIVSINKKSNMSNMELHKLAHLSDTIIESILKDSFKNMSEQQQLISKQMAKEHFLNLTRMYPRASDRIIMCKYDGKSCNHANFTTIYHRDYHNCYTFRPTRQPRIGKHFGLFVLFMVPSYPGSEWNKNIATINDLTSAGVTVEIMEPNSRSYPVQNGYLCPLSVMTDIEITQSMMDVHEDSNQFNNCEPASLLSYYDLQFEKDILVQRQYRDCTDTEYIKEIFMKCGCYPEGSLLTSLLKKKDYLNSEYCSNIMDTFLNDVSLQHFNILNTTSEKITQINAMINNATGHNTAHRIKCFWRNYKNFAEREMYHYQSKCKQTCSYKFYSKNIIQSPWPLSGTFRQASSKTQMEQVAETIRDYFDLLNINTSDFSRPSMGTNEQLIDIFKIYNISNAENILQACEKKHWNLENCSKLVHLVQENMALISIFSATDTSTNYYVVLSYNFWDMLSDVGGALGLWIGTSAITVIECGVLFLNIFVLTVRLLSLHFRKLINRCRTSLLKSY